MRLPLLPLVAGIVTALIQGCAPLIIAGGAATGLAVGHDRRTTGTVIDDQGIEFNIYTNIGKDKRLQAGTQISVTSYNKVVLLTGSTETADQQAAAEAHARTAAGVQKVFNELRVGPPSSAAEMLGDSTLTTKVKASLLGVNHIEGFDPTRVKVVTSRSVVYLMGLVREAEAEAAVDRARRVRGVQQVVKMFDYIQ